MNFKEIAQQIFSLWNNKKIRNVLFFFICLLILVIFLIMLFSEKKFQPVSERYAICFRCYWKGLVDVKQSIDKLRCPKCGNKIGYAWKCSKCSYEFAVSPVSDGYGSNADAQENNVLDMKCPNCKSVETYPMDAFELKEKSRRYR